MRTYGWQCTPSPLPPIFTPHATFLLHSRLAWSTRFPTCNYMSSSQRRKKMWSSFAKSCFCHTSESSLCAWFCRDTCIKINSDVFQRSISVLEYYANDSSLILTLVCWFLVRVFLIFSSFILFYMPVLQTISKHLVVSEIDQLCERQILARDWIHSKRLLYPWLLYFFTTAWKPYRCADLRNCSTSLALFVNRLPYLRYNCT